MIMKFLQKVPAGLMLVPLLIGAVIHTLFPQALEIGGLTTAAFSNAGLPHVWDFSCSVWVLHYN